MPREQFNDLLEALLRELAVSRRRIWKSKRLMVIGSDLENSTWIEAVEALDAVVVTDDLCTGTRYCFGQVDASLPPMEALARYYLLARTPGPRVWLAGERFAHILGLAEQYRVEGVISQVQRHDDDYGQDAAFLRKAMDERGIPMLEVEVDYGEGPSTEFTTRCEAFLVTLQNHWRAVPKLGASSGSPEHCAATVAAAKPH